MSYQQEYRFGQNEIIHDLRDIANDQLVILKKDVRVYAKHNTTQIALPVGVLENSAKKVASRMLFELKNVRMWKPSEKLTDSGDFRHYGTEFLLHEMDEGPLSECMQRAKALERVGSGIAGIMTTMSGKKEITVRKKEISSLLGLFARKTYIKDEMDQPTDDVDLDKPLKMKVRFAGDRRTKKVNGKFYIKTTGKKVRKLTMDEMLNDFPTCPLKVNSVVLMMPEVLMCGLGYFPQFVVVRIIFEPLSSTGIVLPKDIPLPEGFEVEEDEEGEMVENEGGEAGDF